MTIPRRTLIDLDSTPYYHGSVQLCSGYNQPPASFSINL